MRSLVLQIAVFFFSSFAGADERGLRRVIVIRHCVRSTSSELKHSGIQKFKNKDAYTSHPIASYGVSDHMCTPHGVQTIERTGLLLKELAGDPSGIKIMADIDKRTIDTAAALLRGLGLDDKGYEVNASVFNTLRGSTPLCRAGYSDSELAAEVRSRLETVPMPWNLTRAKAELQDVIGVGAAGPLIGMPGPKVEDDGELTGSVAVMKYFAQDLLYTYLSGITYLNVSAAQRYRFDSWEHWYRSVAEINSKTVTKNAQLIRAILDDLNASKTGTSIYAGHDTNLDGLAAILNVSWDAPPYAGGALLPTPPGSALIFEYRSDSGFGAVNISFLYPTEGHTKHISKPVLLRQSAVLSGLSLEQLRARALRNLGFYPGALACYMHANDEFSIWRWPLVLIAVTLFVFMCALLVGLCLWALSRKSTSQKVEIEEPLNNSE